MKQMNKKDMPKLVALVVLAVCVFGYAVMQLTAGAPATSAASARPAAEQNAPAAGGDAAAAAAAGQQHPAGGAAAAAAVSTFDVSDIAILTSGKDPFIPNGPAAPQDPTAVAAAAAARQQAAAAAAAAAARQQAVAAAGRGPADLGGLIRLPRPGFSAAAAPPNFAAPAAPVLVAAAPAPAPAAVRVAPAPAPLPEPPTYTVTGLVRDESPDACGGKVAILRGGATGDERRFVRCGDSVGNGFKVVAVLRDGVEIQSGKRRVTLTLGGESRAK